MSDVRLLQPPPCKVLNTWWSQGLKVHLRVQGLIGRNERVGN